MFTHTVENSAGSLSPQMFLPCGCAEMCGFFQALLKPHGLLKNKQTENPTATTANHWQCVHSRLCQQWVCGSD